MKQYFIKNFGMVDDTPENRELIEMHYGKQETDEPTFKQVNKQPNNGNVKRTKKRRVTK